MRIRPARTHEVIVLGDSLTQIVSNDLQSALATVGWSAYIDGRVSRSISYPTDPTYSAVDAALAIKTAGVDADTWLVELGTNDLYFIANCGCVDLHAATLARIRLMLSAIGRDHRIIWVGVQNFSFAQLTTVFNDVLQELVNSGEIAGFVDWETLSAGHSSDYFADAAHLSPTGYTVWIPAVVAGLGPPP